MNNDLELQSILNKDREKAEKVNNILLDFLKSYSDLNDKIRTNDQYQIKAAMLEVYRQHEIYNNSMMSKVYTKSYEPYKTVQDLLYELEHTAIKDSKYLKVLKEIPLYSGFLYTPVLINGEINPVIKENSHILSQSKIKQLLTICRENSHISYSNYLYSYIRMSLNKASMTIKELYPVIKKAQEIDTDNILGGNVLDFYLSNFNGKPLFREEENTPSVARFCNHCHRLLQHDETKCKGHNICSHYYEKGKPWYKEVLLNPQDPYDKIYTVTDEYYEFVTLPNLFEEMLYKTLKKMLSKDEYEVTLHPDIEKLGDIKVSSKLTGRTYLIDCKNYNNPSNLKKYILDNNGTLIKSLINRDCTFIFTVPSHHMSSNLLAYINRNKDINKYGYIVRNDLDTVSYILKEDSKSNLVFSEIRSE